MAGRVRSSIPLVLAFLAGAVGGALVAGLWAGRTRDPAPVPSTGVDGSGARPSAGSTADAGGRERVDAAGAVGGPATPKPSGEGPAILSSGGSSGSARSGGERLATGTATLIVTMKDAPPEVASSATVYILPAGGPGVDDASDVPYGAVGASIVVPAPATYDVGVSFDVGCADYSLVRDVHVEIGESRAVDVSGSGTVRRPIHMRLGPGSLDHVPPGAIVAVTWSRTGLGGRGFPGRGEAMHGRPNVTARFDPRTETDTLPLADDGPWHATAGLEEVAVGTGGPLEITVLPRVARPGDTVELRVEANAVVLAHAVRPDGGWPDGTGPLHLVWEGPGRPASYDVRDLEELNPGVGLRVAPGRGRLAWSGPGIQAGISDVLEARAELGAATKVELPLELDPGTVRPSGRLRIRIRGGALPAEGDVAAWVASLRAGTREGKDPSAYVGTFTEDAVFEMEPSPSPEELLFVVGRGARASAPLSARGPGEVDVELLPAGWLVVLPGGIPASRRRTEAATLERIDGAVIPYVEGGFDGSPTHASVRVPLAVGRVLGPFPEGRLRLRLRSGGIAVAELTVTVRAGAFEPLRLPK